MFKSLGHQTSLYNRIVEQIKAALAEGRLQPGDRLPPERELCAQLGVSRGSLREAIKVLAGNGILSVRHGQGIFVVEANPTQLVAELAKMIMAETGTHRDLFEIRQLLEVAAAGWAAERAAPVQVAALAQVVAEAREGKESDRFTAREYERYDQRFHTLIAEATGNLVLVRTMQNLMGLLRQVRQSSLNIPGRPQASITDHEQIFAAILAQDRESAQVAMLKHLQEVEESIAANPATEPKPMSQNRR